MKAQKQTSHHGTIAIAVLILLALACNLQSAAAPQTPSFDPTKAALEMKATSMSLQLTQQALEAQQTAATAVVQPTALTVSDPPTAALPPNLNTPAATATENSPTAAPVIEDQMKSAKILLYEDTPFIGLWIKDTLDGMGLKYTFVGDALGTFMENLNSGIQWDLIIVGAEAHDEVSGDFFDLLTDRVVQDDTALIVEMWYLDLIAGGRVKPLITKCGVELQKNYDIASSIYWLDSDSPFFTEPNIAVPLIHYDLYWQYQAGDYLRLVPGSEATLLGGMYQNRDSDYGVIATCFDGRVIFQTFCNHDYHQEDIQLLWENYIYNTLKNHFAAIKE
jgi:hypothetical protein